MATSKKILTIFFLYLTFTTFLFSQEKRKKEETYILNKIALKSDIFKSNLGSIANSRPIRLNNSENSNLNIYVIHVSKLQKRKDVFVINISNGSLKDVRPDMFTDNTLGYFYLKKTLFIVKGHLLDDLFSIKKKTKIFQIESNNSNGIEETIVDASLYLWIYTYHKGYIQLERGRLW